MLGMRGTGDWATDQRPYNWRQSILYLYPNGSAPLTAILSKLAEEKVDDAQFHWWTKMLPAQGGDITNIYTNAAMDAAYAAGGVAGDVLYVKVAAETVAHFRVGHQVLLRDASDYDVDVNAKVVDVTTNGANSCVAVKLIEDDDNSTSHDLSDADRILVIGNVNPEGGAMPDAIAYDPTKWYNYTQIFRTPLDITRTARLTRLRTGDAYKEAKRECLELHSIEMEKAFIWGQRYEGVGDNGKPERFTMGLVQAIRYGSDGTSNVGTVDDYSLNADYSGQTWLQGGEDWLDEQLEVMFRYGRHEKLAMGGSGAILGINRLVKTNGNYQISEGTVGYGIKVMKWITPFGVINLLLHPLFSFETTNRNSLVIFEPASLKYRYITDTTFYPDKEKQNTGEGRIDGTKEEYLTECGLEYHHPNGWGYLNGLNTDNSV